MSCWLQYTMVGALESFPHFSTRIFWSGISSRRPITFLRYGSLRRSAIRRGSQSMMFRSMLDPFSDMQSTVMRQPNRSFGSCCKATSCRVECSLWLCHPSHSRVLRQRHSPPASAKLFTSRLSSIFRIGAGISLPMRFSQLHSCSLQTLLSDIQAVRIFTPLCCGTNRSGLKRCGHWRLTVPKYFRCLASSRSRNRKTHSMHTCFARLSEQ